MLKDKWSYSDLINYIYNGKDLYQCYKKPSYSKQRVWKDCKRLFVKCAIWRYNTFHISIIGILDNGNIQIVYPTRSIIITKGEDDD